MDKQPFSIGDIVKCVESASCIKAGCDYVIRDISCYCGDWFVYVDGIPSPFYAKRFRLKRKTYLANDGTEAWL